MRAQFDEVKREKGKLEVKLKSPCFDIEKYRDSDKNIEFYTGRTRYSMMLTCKLK